MAATAQPSPDDQDIDSAFETLATGATPASEDDVRAAIRTLARSSKEDVAIRKRLVDATILHALTQTVAHNASDLTVVDPALRCIGNACADNDEARGIVLDIGLAWIVQCLRRYIGEARDEAASLLTIKVLYNMCSECEPMQQRCYEERLHYDLVAHLSALEEAETPDIAFAGDLLLWITGQKETCEPTLTSALAKQQLEAIVQFPCIFADVDDLDQFATFAETALIYLRDTTVQEQVLREKLVEEVWEILKTQDDLINALDQTDEDQVDDIKLLAPLGTSIVWVLSDLAAHSDFGKTYTFQDDWVVQLIELIKAAGSSRHQTSDLDSPGHSSATVIAAACQMIGNLLWSLAPAEAAEVVQRIGLHKYLYSIITCNASTASDSSLLHSVAGLLIQVSRPSLELRAKMGEEVTALPALEVLCRNSTTQVKQEGIRLLRALGKDCPVNQERLADLAKEAMISLREDKAQENQATELPTGVTPS